MLHHRALLVSFGVLGVLAPVASAQRYVFAVDAQRSSLVGELSASVPATGSFIGDYDQTANPTGTRTLNFDFLGRRPAPPANIRKNFTGTGALSGNPNTRPSGAFTLDANTTTRRVTLTDFNADLLRDARPNFNLTVTITYQSFLTATPNYAYPFIIAIPIPLGQATLNALTMQQALPMSGDLTPGGTPNTFTFSLAVPVVVAGSMSILDNPLDIPPLPQIATFAGTITINGETATATLSSNIDQSQTIMQEIQGPADQPFDFPAPPGGNDGPAHLLVTASVTEINMNLMGTLSLPAAGTRFRCPADFDDGSGTGRPDGGVTIDDLLYYLDIYARGIVAADLDDGSGNGIRDGGVTIDDLLYFLARFTAGC